jgi:hypothetical protein
MVPDDPDDLEAFDQADPPPGWSRTRGFLCSCIWRYDADLGWFELITWNPDCGRHPQHPTMPL